MRTGQGIGKRAALAALVLTMGGYAMPASADTAPITAYYRDPALGAYNYPGPANAVIGIDVKASVGGTCGFATNGVPNGTVNAGAIDTTGWSGQVPFTAECTAPWRIAVSSQNGALKNATAPQAGYANLAPYDVALSINSDGGTVTGTCPVAQLDQALVSSPCTFKGTASTINGLQVPRSYDLPNSYIQLSAPAYPGSDILVSGTYNDTLIVTVSPAV